MKLDKKRALAARMFGVGKDRIWLNPQRLQEIKEAITKQDMRDLLKEKVIIIKEITGTKSKKKRKRRKTRRRAGSVSFKIKDRSAYRIKIRKLRKHLKRLKSEGKLTREQHKKFRRYSKSGIFKDLKHLKEYLSNLK